MTTVGYTKAYAESIHGLKQAVEVSTPTYDEMKRIAKACLGDRGDRFICPLTRKEMRKARRKSRSIKAHLLVSADGVKPRKYKTFKGAKKYYLALKKDGYKPYITDLMFGVSVTSPVVGPSIPLENSRALAVVPVVHSRPEKVRMEDVSMGPVIEHIDEEPKSIFESPRLAFLKDLPVVRDFKHMPPDVQNMLMGIALFATIMLGVIGNVTASAGYP